ncbi:SRPBCC family protein [Amycolatopsis echigonensis]|uniref:Polyketide cyclase/dehydrase/lipid transport protein n=1 Tax=Amycolatopsis echigonensis TaxID=2576905 RepID=A0A2N3WKS4_9PSEU|nr:MULTISPECIES: SRPBCC family protein [Amycolatopsis]MBB2503464.1 SRPBCC family protein [Amycolatopsis echigonensis]PKV94473.1 polyketide cyclase/dehydrase/lipid transport protein [Amycolatopsis niigatensis]
MTEPQLPVLDEHRIVVDADAETAWRAVNEVADRVSGRVATGYAWAVGAADWKATGPRPLAEGSTVPGFRVVAAEPPRLLALAGRHRFSEYRLTFRLEPGAEGQTLIRAESRARFPGVLGAGYRLLVVGSGGHVFSMRRMLGTIARLANG